MTNIYLTDSDEEAIVALCRTTRSCTTRLMNISRTKQGRTVSWSSSPTVESCLSRCARPGMKVAKGMLQEADAIEVWTGPEGDAEHQGWIQDKFGFLR